MLNEIRILLSHFRVFLSSLIIIPEIVENAQVFIIYNNHVSVCNNL